MSCWGTLTGAECRRLAAGGDQDRGDAQIGKLMQQLIETEKNIMPRIGSREFESSLNLLLRPVDMIVDDEFTDDNRQGNEEARRKNDYRRNRTERMQASVEKSSWMTVFAFVQEHVGRLENEVEDVVLRQQDDQKREDGSFLAVQFRLLSIRLVPPI